MEITLRGFSRKMGAHLSRSWLCRLEPDEGSREPFLFELVADASLVFEEDAVQQALSSGDIRHRRAENEDHLLLPGAKVRIWPGRRAATIAVHPDLFDRFDLVQLATEGALTRALASYGAVCIHAAAFEIEGIPILAVGPSGAGKSTLTAVALAAGGRVVSDDSLILGRSTDGTIIVRPSRPDLLFRDPSPELLPSNLRSRLIPVSVGGQPKWWLRRQDQPSSFLNCASPRSLFFVERDRHRTHARKDLIQSAALAELLVANVGSYLLGKGHESDLAGVIQVFRALLSQASAETLWTGNLTAETQEDLATALTADSSPI